MRTMLLALLAFWGSAAVSQPVLQCPPGPFSCVPWNPPSGGGNPSPPPPPFFEVEPRFIQPEKFQGFIGSGQGSNLEIHEDPLPDNVRELIEDSGIAMDPDKLYLLTGETSGVDLESDYIIFNGVRIE